MKKWTKGAIGKSVDLDGGAHSLSGKEYRAQHMLEDLESNVHFLGQLTMFVSEANPGRIIIIQQVLQYFLLGFGSSGQQYRSCPVAP